jgi:ATP-dependent RNA helicase HelY
LRTTLDFNTFLTNLKTLCFPSIVFSMANSRKPKTRVRNNAKPNFRRPSNDRNFKRETGQESSSNFTAVKPTVAELKQLEQLLSGIGTPKSTEFVPDAFQLEALEAIENEDVLVTAPTGSGKTWIAREEIRRMLEKGKRAWYTTPLKALTNSKYQEFGQEFGFENVGILTGDRKENGNAPLIVGTTEIYRNQLFDALRSGEQMSTDFVILDEAHYLADEERGHVWEEAIILSPPRVRLLLLSATIGNAQEFASWIEEVRDCKVRIINRAGQRPVELRAAFLSSQQQLFPLLDEFGKLNPNVEKFTKNRNNNDSRRRR